MYYKKSRLEYKFHPRRNNKNSRDKMFTINPQSSRYFPKNGN